MWNGSNGIPSTIDGINDFVQSRITKANEYYIYIYNIYIYIYMMYVVICFTAIPEVDDDFRDGCCCCANTGIPAGRGIILFLERFCPRFKTFFG